MQLRSLFLQHLAVQLQGPGCEVSNLEAWLASSGHERCCQVTYDGGTVEGLDRRWTLRGCVRPPDGPGMRSKTCRELLYEIESQFQDEVEINESSVRCVTESAASKVPLPFQFKKDFVGFHQRHLKDHTERVHQKHAEQEETTARERMKQEAVNSAGSETDALKICRKFFVKHRGGVRKRTAKEQTERKTGGKVTDGQSQTRSAGDWGQATHNLCCALIDGHIQSLDSDNDACVVGKGSEVLLAEDSEAIRQT